MPPASCMCLESAIGFIPVILAGALIWSGLSRPLSLPPEWWMVAIPSVLLLGFWLKDYVVEGPPWRIRHHPDHVNMVFKWKKR